MRDHLIALVLCCLFCVQGFSQVDDIIGIPEIQHDETFGDLTGLTTWRFYAVFTDPDFRLRRVTGTNSHPLSIGADSDVWLADGSVLNAGLWNCDSLAANNERAFDTFVTIGMASSCPYAEPVSASLVSPDTTAVQSYDWSSSVPLNGTDWMYEVHPNHPASIPDENGRVLVAQITTAGTPFLTMNVEIYPNDDPEDLTVLNAFTATLVTPGCTDPQATNFDPSADSDDGSCTLGPLRGIVVQDLTPADPPEGYPVGGRTELILAQMNSPTDALSSMFGTNGHPLSIASTDGYIWNAADGAIVGSQISAASIVNDPVVGFDSFVTIGRLTADSPGTEVLTLELLPGNSLVEAMATVTGTDLILEDGLWMGVGDDVNLYGTTEDLLVPVAQVTHTGNLEYALSLLCFDENNDAWFYSHSSSDLHPEYISGQGYQLSASGNAANACFDPTACNYAGENPYLIDDASTCVYTGCQGCGTFGATNYDPLATQEGEPCQFPCSVVLTDVSWECTATGIGTVETAVQLTATYDAICNIDSICLVFNENLEQTCFNFEAAGITLVSGVPISMPFAGLTSGTYSLVVPNTDAVSGTTVVEVTACIPGCQDPLAENFNPAATVEDNSCVYDDCSDNELFITVDTELFAGFIGLSVLTEEGETAFSRNDYTNNASFLDSVCVGNGCHEIWMSTQLGGGGWQGASYSIAADGQVFQEGTLTTGTETFDIININSSCPLDGCTDPDALNFDPIATLFDFSCIYADDSPSGEGDAGGSDELEIDVSGDANSGQIGLTLNGIPGAGNVDLLVIDGVGRLMWRDQFSASDGAISIALNTSSWRTGYYIIIAEQDGNSSVLTVVKSLN